MKLSDYVLEELGSMVVGDEHHFPYRSSYRITQFFESIGLPFKHDGSTRRIWAKERLAELNSGVSRSPDLPSNDLCKVISRLFDPDDFARANKRIEGEHGNHPPADVNLALAKFNEVVKRYGIVAYMDGKTGRAFVKSTGAGVSSEDFLGQVRPLSSEEVAQREKLASFLDRASEDEFIEKVLVPLFQRLQFRRVSPTGHKDKSLEFGKDLWMKFQLPTGHWLYFSAQVKKDKIDSNNASGLKNVSSILNQARMAFDHPIFDPDENRKVLLDHLFIISAGEITKAAKHWLAGQLDASQRRQIIFMDRNELLDHAAKILLDLRIEEPIAHAVELSDDNIPF
jgi:hypothetical protein